jgi:hypothetical protein
LGASRNVRPGKKSRKSCGGSFQSFKVRGGCQPICPADPIGRLPKGPCFEVARIFLNPRIDWQRMPKKQHDLTPAAVELLDEYLQRRAFWQAFQDGVSIEKAGRVHLRVGKSRAHEIFKEIKEDPLRWFQQKFLILLAEKKVHGGLATASSKDADGFFCCLLGGTEDLNRIARRLSGERVVIVSDLFGRYGVPTLDREAILYSAHSGLLRSSLLKEMKQAG